MEAIVTLQFNGTDVTVGKLFTSIRRDIDLTQTAAARKQRPFLELRRPEWYD